MSFNRLLFRELESWKSRANRKPLILRGARQVGKTTLVKEFAKSYTHSIQLNLERSQDVQFFEDFDDVTTLVDALFLNRGIDIKNQKNTLLFIDEIQASPKAISLLRYFYEDLPKLHVIAAGSLLEHTMGEVKSFPVGRVSFLYLHPLNFQEYLEALGRPEILDALMQTPIEKHAHAILMRFFHEYAVVGGMPEVVQNFLETHSISGQAMVYESIWETYKQDVEKYAKTTSESRTIKHIMNVSHLYLDQRIKFQNFGNSNYKSREVGEAMRSLDDARIIQLMYPTTSTAPPIKPDLKKSPRLQFLDTGLVNYALKIQGDMLALSDLNDAFRGAVIPHLIAQEVLSINAHQYEKPNFWVREKTQSSSEVDLVLTVEGKVVPVEIKSGKVGKLKSLQQFVDQSEHPYAVRMFAGEFSVEQHKTSIGKKPFLLMNLPYYLGTRLNEFISYFVQNYTLSGTDN